MKQQKSFAASVLTFLCVVSLTCFASADTFDFAIGASDWSGNVDSVSTSGLYHLNNINPDTGKNGYIMQLTPVDSGALEETLTMFHDDQMGGDGPHDITSVFHVHDAFDINQVFVVDSINWFNVTELDNGGAGPGASRNSIITGYIGGVNGTMVFQLTGDSDPEVLVDASSDLVTFGDMTGEIDTLVWQVPDAVDGEGGYYDGIFGSRLDNIDFTVVSNPGGGDIATFDFTIGTSDWSGNVDAPSTNGVFNLNNVNDGTENGFIMQLAAADSSAPDDQLVMFHDDQMGGDGPHNIKSVFTVQDSADTNQMFKVESLNWFNSTAFDAAGDGAGIGTSSNSIISGYSGGIGGTLQWQLTGDSDLGTVVNASSPLVTTGDMALPIDTMVWEVLDAVDGMGGYYDGIFGSVIDNLVIDLDVSGGGPVTVTPDSYEVTFGTYFSGSEVELAASDNEDLSIRRSNTDVNSRTEFTVKSTSPTATPVSFEFTLEGSAFFRTTVIQTIELFDYSTSSWELVDTRDASRIIDATTTVAPTGDLSRFVEPGTNCIEARIHYESLNRRQGFASNTDLTQWVIE